MQQWAIVYAKGNTHGGVKDQVFTIRFMESGSLNSRAAGSGVVKGMVKDLKTKYNRKNVAI